MGLSAAVWHLLNFVAVPLALALSLPLVARWLYRASLGRAPLRRLWCWTVPAALAAAAAAVVGFGHDGTIAGYGLMIAAVSIAMQVAAARATRSASRSTAG